MKILKLFHIPAKPKKLEKEKACLILSCRCTAFPIDCWLSAVLVDVPSKEKSPTCLKCGIPRSFSSFCSHVELQALYMVISLLSLICSFWYDIVCFFPLVFLLSISLKLTSFCAWAASEFPAPFFVSLLSWKSVKHLFWGRAQFSFLYYFSSSEDFK